MSRKKRSTSTPLLPILYLYYTPPPGRSHASPQTASHSSPSPDASASFHFLPQGSHFSRALCAHALPSRPQAYTGIHALTLETNVICLRKYIAFACTRVCVLITCIHALALGVYLFLNRTVRICIVVLIFGYKIGDHP